MKDNYKLVLSLGLVLSALTPTDIIAQTVSTEVVDGAQYSQMSAKGQKQTRNVRPEATGKKATGAPAVLKADASNTVYGVPYYEYFAKESDFAKYTVIDANNDKCTWAYWSGNIRYTDSEDNNADDWLITPSIALKGGVTYLVSFQAGNFFYPEKIEAKWGSGNTVAAMTNNLVATTTISNNRYRLLQNTITPATDGNYNIGLHAVGDKGGLYMFVNYIAVEQEPATTAPDSVTSLKATADPTGRTNVTLSFSAPAKDVAGSSLSAVDSIQIYNGSTLLTAIKDATPGKAIQYTDTKAAQGSNTYAIIAYNNAGPGRTAKATVSAGVDTPTQPNVKATDNIDSVKLSWNESTGANKKVVIPSEIDYEIHAMDGNLLGDSITTVRGKTEYTINESTNVGTQEYKGWAVRAKNAAGNSRYTAAYVIMGATYSIPFSNSFSGGSLEDQFIGLISNNNVSWEISADSSADNDGGAVEFAPTKSGQSTFHTGKISLKGAKAPKLIFSYYGAEGENAVLAAEIQHQSGAIDTLWTHDFSTGTAASGAWKTQTIDLPQSLASENYIIVRFRGNSGGSIEDKPLYVDNIHVADPTENDIAVSLDGPSNAVKGRFVALTAKIQNRGTSAVKDVAIKVTANGQVIADTTLTKPIEMLREAQLPIRIKTTSLMEGQSLTIIANATSADDPDLTNNADTAVVALTQNDVNAPTDLKAETALGQPVSLSWTAPQPSGMTITDSFEDYAGWATSGVGKWTFVNKDNSQFGYVTGQKAEPNIDAYAAWEVWKPSDVFTSDEGVNPHTGSQCLASIWKCIHNTTTDRYRFVDADDWIISPELSGKAQTITFWVNNAVSGDDGIETFRVLASSTDTATTSFTQIGNQYTQSNAKWTEISVTLPEGSKYFAIQRTTSRSDQFLILLDDVTYEAALKPVSYNIYCDGKLVGNTTETKYSYNQPTDGNHTYSVTAVYEDGSESLPATASATTAITDITVNGNAVVGNVYTIDGKLVCRDAQSLDGLTRGVYVINGKKVLIK